MQTDHLRAFERAYSGLYTKVFRYLRWRLSCREDAEEATSDVFVKALSGIDGYDETKGNLEQWVVGIAKRVLIDLWRKRRLVSVSLDSVEELSENEDVVDDLNAFVDGRAILEQVGEADRVMLVMRYVDGYSHEEIAAHVGKTSAAVRKYYSRLLASLRESIS